MKDIIMYQRYADKLKTIAHPDRLCIVHGLMESTCNVTKIQECLGLPQSTVSQHLSKLKAAGIIVGERKGLEISYRVEDKDIINVVKLLFDVKN